MSIPNFIEHDLWGSLQPLDGKLYRMDFFRFRTFIKIGRHPQVNDFVLPGARISNQHCEILWENKSVVLEDMSSNGTWINGGLVGKGKKQLLHDGDQVAFGTTMPQDSEDYRFTFRTHTTDLREYERGEMYLYYDIAHEIGSGGFGTVSKGLCLATGEWVAIKVITPPKAFGKDFVGNIILMAREVNIMSNLNHPNICRLKDAFYHEHDGTLNLVMELVPGGDLLDYMNAGSVNDESDAKFIIWQICDALSYLHIKGVTHRDIKPENILLSKDSKDVPPIVKLSDFGMAKIVDDHTMLRTACGTPEYMPPEQGQHGGSYDHLVDSWSVGVIVFQMFTDSLPIERLNTSEQRLDDWDPLMRWDLLDKARVLEEGKRFVRALLRSNPKERMTMKNAPRHQWMSPWVGKMEKARDELLGDNAEYQHLNYLEDYRLEEEPET